MPRYPRLEVEFSQVPEPLPLDPATLDRNELEAMLLMLEVGFTLRVKRRKSVVYAAVQRIKEDPEFGGRRFRIHDDNGWIKVWRIE